jgi:hypothetical protein
VKTDWKKNYGIIIQVEMIKDYQDKNVLAIKRVTMINQMNILKYLVNYFDKLYKFKMDLFLLYKLFNRINKLVRMKSTIMIKFIWDRLL